MLAAHQNQYSCSFFVCSQILGSESLSVCIFHVIDHHSEERTRQVLFMLIMYVRACSKPNETFCLSLFPANIYSSRIFSWLGRWRRTRPYKISPSISCQSLSYYRRKESQIQETSQIYSWKLLPRKWKTGLGSSKNPRCHAAVRTRQEPPPSPTPHQHHHHHQFAYCQYIG